MLFENLASVKARIAEAARRAGRDPAVVEILAVTKYATEAQAAEAAGLFRHLGESRVQAAEGRIPRILDAAKGARPQWHMVGHLQSNKAAKAAALFDWLDSLDDAGLARRLDREAGEAGRRLKVLVQVKTHPNPRQSGVEPEALGDLLKQLKGLKNLDVRGLMAIAPELEPVEDCRPHFRKVRRLFETQFSADGVLSMGMSRDFEVAVEEGATMVRLGTILFSTDLKDNVVRRPT